MKNNGLIYNRSFWIVTSCYFSVVIFILSILKLPALSKILILLSGLAISVVLSALSVIGANYAYGFIRTFISNPKHSNKILKIMPKSFYIYILEKISKKIHLYIHSYSGQVTIGKNLIQNDFSTTTVYKNSVKNCDSLNAMEFFLTPASSPLYKMSEEEKQEITNILMDRIFLSKETLSKEIKRPGSLTRRFYPAVFLYLSVNSFYNEDGYRDSSLELTAENIEKIVEYILDNGEYLFISYFADSRDIFYDPIGITANYYYEALKNFGKSSDLNKRTIYLLYDFVTNPATISLMSSNSIANQFFSELQTNILNNPNFKMEEYMNFYLDNFVNN